MRAAIGWTLRAALAAAAAATVLWAFAHVGIREASRLWEDDGRIELTVMHWSGEGGPEEDAIVVDALRRFEADHPNIRVRRINPGDALSFYTKLQTMQASGEPPDVFYVGNERVPSFVELGLLRPLDDFIAADAESDAKGRLDLDAFFPATVDAFRYDGSRTGTGPLYGIPKDFTTVGFYVNLDLFRKAGIEPPREGWTWDDYIAAARAIGKLPGVTGSEFVTWPPMVRAYLMTEGLDVKGESFDDLRTSDPAVVAALERLRAWRHDESGTLTSGKSKIATGATVFLTGNVGMAGPFGRWVVPSYRKIPPPGEPGGFAWDFVSLPRGKTDANIVLTVSWSVSAQSRHPEAAWALVRALSGDDAQRRIASLGLAIPTIRDAARSASFNDPAQEPDNDAGYLAAAERAQVVEWPADPMFESLLGSRLDQGLKTADLPLAQAIANFEGDWRTRRDGPLANDAMPPMPWTALTWIGAGVAAAALVAWWMWIRGGGLSVRERREERTGYALASPWILGFVVLMAFPVALSLALSLSRWKGVSPLAQAEWAGLANYEQLLVADRRMRTSLQVTVLYALLAVPAGQALALAAALLMNMRVRGIALFRAAWYLPSVLAGVGVAVLWRWVFDADGGLANSILGPVCGLINWCAGLVGARTDLSPPEWFGADAARWGVPAFAIMSLWFVGGSMMTYLAGLQQVPADLQEAAAIDGAGAWRRFRSVTLPMLSPVILFNLVMAVISSFQVFTQAFIMTGGEPGDLTRFYVLYLYNQGFDFYDMGYASAMAWILLVVVLALTAVILRTSSRWVHYEGMRA
jgi:multiple sugar transport system permease protein